MVCAAALLHRIPQENSNSAFHSHGEWKAPVGMTVRNGVRNLGAVGWRCFAPPDER